MSVNKLPETTEPPGLRAKHPLHRASDKHTSEWLSKKKTLTLIRKRKNCFTISDKQPSSTDTTATAPASTQPTVTDKGHFVLLDLKRPDSKQCTRVPFQIDSAASCNTLPSSHLSDMRWANLSPTKTDSNTTTLCQSANEAHRHPWAALSLIKNRLPGHPRQLQILLAEPGLNQEL